MEPGANIDLSQFSKLDSNVFLPQTWEFPSKW